MTKVKIFDTASTDSLEAKVNNWLADHRYSDILSVQYAIHEHSLFPYTVCITYRDGS